MRRLLLSAVLTSVSSYSYSQCSTVYTAPFSENFDNSPTWQSAHVDCVYPSVFLMGNIDPCWQRSNNSSTFSDHVFVGGPVTDSGCGKHPPSTKTGSGKYIRPFQYGISTNNPATLTSPKIDISGLISPEIEFWHRLLGINNLYTQVKGVNSSTWINLDTVRGSNVLIDTLWRSAVFNLPPMGSDTIQVRFVVDEVYNTVVAIDDFQVKEGSPCPRVSGLTVIATSDSSVTLDWAGGAGNCQVAYGVGQCYADNTSNTVLNLNSKPATIYGLSPNTLYTFFIRDSCGNATPSHWSLPESETTECTFLVAPFLETFDGPNFAPSTGILNPGLFDDCYERAPDTNYDWHVYDSLSATYTINTGADLDHTSGQGNYLGTSGTGLLNSANLYTPFIDISNLQNPVLTFWLHMYGADIEKLEISAVSNNFYVLLDSIIGQQQTSKSAPWIEMNINLGNLPSNIFKIRFTGTKKSNGYIYNRICLDDLEVHDVLSCTGPYNFSIDSVATTSAHISWHDSTSSHWKVEYGLSGYTPGQGIRKVSLQSKNLAIKSLHPGTNYDYYLQGVCGTLDSSSVIGPFSFTTNCDSLFANFRDTANALEITLDASTSYGSDVKYLWDFGDGNTGGGMSYSHTYLNADRYTITLVAQDTCSQADTLKKTIQVCDSIHASFTYTTVDTIITFIAHSLPGISQYYWAFSDGSLDSGMIAQHTFTPSTSAPPFTANLTVTNKCNALDSITQTLPANLRTPENAFNDIFIYPNPSSSNLYVDFSCLSLTNVELLIFDSAGHQIIPSTSQSTNGIQVDVSKYTGGIYFLYLKSREQQAFYKIIISN